MSLSAEKQAIADAINDRLQAGVSQRHLARTIGISDSTLSKMRGITVGADTISESTWRKVGTFFSLDKWKLIGTANYNTIQSVCESAQRLSLMRVVAAYSGAGKTTALKRYRHRKDVTNAYYVLCQASMTKRDFLRAIAVSMGLQKTGTIHNIITLIAKQLNSQHKPLLMLDDVGKLIDSQLLLIQQLRDLTEDNVGMVLAGVDYVYDNLIKGVQRGKVGYPELVSRMGSFQPLSKPTLQEVEGICKHNSIEDPAVARMIFSQHKEFRAIRAAIQDLQVYADDNSKPLNIQTAMDLWGQQ